MVAATAEKKSPRTRLVEFLEEIEADVRLAEQLLRSIEIKLRDDLGSNYRTEFSATEVVFTVTAEWIVHSRQEFGRLRGRIVEAAEEARRHADIEAMRLRTRGRISERRQRLAARLARAQRVLEQLAVFYRTIVVQPDPVHVVVRTPAGEPCEVRTT